jgi:hypothetical protein
MLTTCAACTWAGPLGSDGTVRACARGDPGEGAPGVENERERGGGEGSGGERRERGREGERLRARPEKFVMVIG